MRSILLVLVARASAQVMRAGDDAGRQAFGDPGMEHKVADLGVNLQQVAGANVAEFAARPPDSPRADSYARFRKELRIARARVNQVGQAEDGQQRVDVAARVFRPIDARHVARIKIIRWLAQRRLAGPSDECGCGNIPGARTRATSNRPCVFENNSSLREGVL